MRILQKEKLRAQQHEMEQSKTLNKAKSSEVSFAQGSLASSVSALASVVIVGKAKSKCVEILSFRDWQCSRAGASAEGKCERAPLMPPDSRLNADMG